MAGEIDVDTSCQIEKLILTDEIQHPEFLEFAVENISELLCYLVLQRVFEINHLPESCLLFYV